MWFFPFTYLPDHIIWSKSSSCSSFAVELRTNSLAWNLKPATMTLIYQSLNPENKFLIGNYKERDSETPPPYIPSSLLCSKLFLPFQLSSHFIQGTNPFLSTKSIQLPFLLWIFYWSPFPLFPTVAIINYHKLNGLKHHIFISSQFCSLETQADLSMSFSEDSWEWFQGVDQTGSYLEAIGKKKLRLKKSTLKLLWVVGRVQFPVAVLLRSPTPSTAKAGPSRALIFFDFPSVASPQPLTVLHS